ncbi:MAG: hypothetical protein LBR84_10800, partial [Tannerella sp.]|nr:hypothetical protein [Tannerella sp.]
MNAYLRIQNCAGANEQCSLPARRSPRGLSMTTLLFALAALLFASTGDAPAQRTAAVGNDTSKVETRGTGVQTGEPQTVNKVINVQTWD